MTWKPAHTRDMDTEDIGVGCRVQTSIGGWCHITSRVVHRNDGLILWDGFDVDTQDPIEGMRGWFGETRTVGWD